MEPLEYCRLYVKSPKPEKEGIELACVRTLTEATFGVYSYQTIDKNWGSQFEKRPDTVLQIIEVAHTINLIAIKLEVIQPTITELLEQVSAVAPYKKHK